MESTPRLKAAIFVRALIRRAEVAGASAFIVRKGAEDAGAVILRLSRLDKTALVLNRGRIVHAGDSNSLLADPDKLAELVAVH